MKVFSYKRLSSYIQLLNYPSQFIHVIANILLIFNFPHSSHEESFNVSSLITSYFAFFFHMSEFQSKMQFCSMKKFKFFFSFSLSITTLVCSNFSSHYSLSFMETWKKKNLEVKCDSKINCITALTTPSNFFFFF